MRVFRHTEGRSAFLQAPFRAWVSAYPCSRAYCPQIQYYCNRKRRKMQYIFRDFCDFFENSSFNQNFRGEFAVFHKKQGKSLKNGRVFAGMLGFERFFLLTNHGSCVIMRMGLTTPGDGTHHKKRLNGKTGYGIPRRHRKN